MDYKLAEVGLLIRNNDCTNFTRTGFKYCPSGASSFDEESGSSEITSTPGWLGLKLEEFDDWENTHTIDLAYPGGRNEEHVFSVDHLRRKPERKGEWLWFPVQCLDGVTGYRD